MRQKQTQKKQKTLLFTLTAFCLAGFPLFFLWFLPFKAHVQYAHVDGATIGYYMRGHGKPLLVHPGFGMTLSDMDPSLLRVLAKTHTVILYDYRGGGYSTGNVEQLTIPQMTDDAVQLLQYLRIQKASVLSWSYGTLIAQDMVVRYPQMIDRVILASPVPTGSEKILSDRTIQLFVQKHLAEGWEDAFVPLLFLRTAEGDLLKKSYLTRLHTAMKTGEIPPRRTIPVETKVAQEYAASLDLSATFEKLRESSLPVSILVAEEDMLVKPENAKILARQIPSATVRTFPNAGHGFLFQERKDVSLAIQQALK